MSTERDRAVQSLLEVLPMSMRTLGMAMRQLGPNLAPGHFRLLHLLAERPHHLTELAGHQGVTPPTMSNSVSTLVERGWAERVRDPQDRRRVLIQLSPAGRAVLDGMHERLSVRVAELCSSLSVSELEDLAQGLAIIRRVFALGRSSETDR